MCDVFLSPLYLRPLSPSYIYRYNGVWTIDHDDGSQYWNDTRNVMLWGGCKNYLGNHKSCDHNVIIHPGIEARSAGGRKCQTDDNNVWQEQYHHDNHCYVVDGAFYTMRGGAKHCSEGDLDPHVYTTFGNTLYSTNASFHQGPCGSFAAWQGAGQDVRSTVKEMPPANEIVARAKALLPPPTPSTATASPFER